MKPPILNCFFKIYTKTIDLNTGVSVKTTLIEDRGFLELKESSGSIDEIMSENIDINGIKKIASKLMVELNFDAGSHPIASLQVEIVSYQHRQTSMFFIIKEIEHIPLSGFPSTLYLIRSFDS